MSRKIYVGNLNYATLEDSIRDIFARHGQVESVTLGRDRLSGQPRGFAFVEMATEAQAALAIRALDGSELDGRRLRVNAAQESRRQSP
ncbi:MAG TPA: RNA-binding protein [Spirochaetales bacterium]|nr:RNA-binding protein [Spirochaetales bacterium]MBP7262802.1 RNA-binding protein [Spirochaetia bacterium]HPE35889.1 RNA-binding protein [Spirochaetales bacterium]